MNEFSILGFIEHTARLSYEITKAEVEALREAGKIVQTEAKDSVGEYQNESGPFAAWEPLALSTMEDRQRQGYPINEPELRTGELRDSIEITVLPWAKEVEIGSDSDVMVYQELGTDKMPPRSILGGAAARKETEVVAKIGERAVLALLPPGMSPKAISS